MNVLMSPEQFDMYMHELSEEDYLRSQEALRVLLEDVSRPAVAEQYRMTRADYYALDAYFDSLDNPS